MSFQPIPSEQKKILPIGEIVLDTRPASRPTYHIMNGRYVTLEPLCPEKHGHSLYEDFRTEPELMWTYSTRERPADWEAFQTLLISWSSSEEIFAFAVIEKQTGRPLGIQSLLRFDLPNRIMEVGIVLYGPSLQRTRAATEAQYLFASYVFDVLGFRRYVWKSDNLNAASKAAALRLGFTLEGVLRQSAIENGLNVDMAWFSLLDIEWPKHKTALEAWLDPTNFDDQGRQIKKLSEFKS